MSDEHLDLDALEKEFRNSVTKLVWADVAIDLVRRLRKAERELAELRKALRMCG